MLGVDPKSGASLVRLWIAAGSAALLVLVCAAAFLQQGQLASRPAVRTGLIMASAIFGSVMTWALLDRAALAGAAAERRALELRARELSAQVLIPGSPLACLDALVGESVEAACEKSLFASPATVAAASAYVGEQLTLLANMTAFAQGAEPQAITVQLRRALETDRFGFVAYVLAIRDGCTGQHCKTLALFHELWPRAHQSDHGRARTLSRTLWGSLDSGAGCPGCGHDPSALRIGGRGPRPTAAQARQYRFSERRFDPCRQYHEPGAERAGASWRGGGCRRQSQSTDVWTATRA